MDDQSKLAVFVVALILSSGLCTPLWSAETPLSVEDQRIAAYYLGGMWDMRERLNSGEFKAVERQFWPTVNRPDAYSEIKVNASCAFDATNQGLRFDRDVISSRPDQSERREFKYARSKNASLRFDAESKSVGKYIPEAPVTLPLAIPWDVRQIGLNNAGEHDVQRSLAQRREFYTGLGAPSSVEENDNLCRITWTFGEQNRMRYRLSIDKSQGFAVVRYENFYRKPADSDNWQYWSGVKVDWLKRGGEFVPQHVEFEDPKSDKQFSIDLEWISINRPIPEERFSWEDFSLPDGTSIWDHRMEPPVMEKVIGAEPMAAVPTKAPSRFWWYVSAGAAVPAALGGCLWLVNRRRKR